MNSQVIIKQQDGSYTLPDGTKLTAVRPGVFQTPDGRKIHRGLVRDFVWCADKMKPPQLATDPRSMDLRGRVVGYGITKNSDGTVTKKKVWDKDNLVVYNGRLWAFHKLFNFPASPIASYMPQWFSCGEGGCTTDNPRNPLYPQDNDTDMYSPVVIDVANPSYADYGKKKPLNPGVYFVTDQIISIIYTIYIDFQEANGAGQTSLNELGLFLSPSQDPTESTFWMFSHVCMSSFFKDVNSALELEWWIYI
jgi:hypothetical protein